jgi:hypothetical protein
MPESASPLYHMYHMYHTCYTPTLALLPQCHGYACHGLGIATALHHCIQWHRETLYSTFNFCRDCQPSFPQHHRFVVSPSIISSTVTVCSLVILIRHVLYVNTS